MGVAITSSDTGRPEWPEGDPELAPERSVPVEELLREFEESGIPLPRATGIEHQLPDYDVELERLKLLEALGG